MNDFIFRTAEAKDYDKIKSLCDERYGTGYITKDMFKNYLDYKELFISAFYNDDFVGFAAMIYSTDENTAKKMGMTLEEVKKYASKKPILIYKSHAIKKKYEKMGLPVAMTSILMSKGKELGYGSVFGSAWIYNNYIPMSKTFDKLGFIPLYKRSNLWYDDENYTCVVCGGRCKCEAMIYVRDLSDWEE